MKNNLDISFSRIISFIEQLKKLYKSRVASSRFTFQLPNFLNSNYQNNND